MLSPDSRSLYTSTLMPPPGYILNQALATTYSLDLQALLTLPTHIALLGRTPNRHLDPISLLESIRRIAGRLSVYVDQSSIKVPSQANILYALLESVIVPVQAPPGGVFHPKLWLMRFIQPDMDEPPLLRLVILSRNITFDKSWDVSLLLEGTPGRRNIAANRELGEFIGKLPAWGIQRVQEHLQEQAEQFGDEVRRTPWELPEGVEDIRFLTFLGKGGPAFKRQVFKRSVIISPFVTHEALQWYEDTFGKITAVVSRPEELDTLPEEAFSLSEKWYTLDETAETEDGEEKESHDTYGLHAKVYIMEQGWRTYLLLGSANATGAALVHGKNVEVLTVLEGLTSKLGGIDSLLSENGLGMVLTEYVRGENPNIDEEDPMPQKALDDAYRSISEAGLKVLCSQGEHDWDLSLVSSKDTSLKGISELRIWPVTVSYDRARVIAQFRKGIPSALGRFGMEALTCLMAFELTEEIENKKLRFVLNLPVNGIPEDRDSAIFRRIVHNKENFLKYLLLLLSEHEEGIIGQVDPPPPGDGNKPRLAPVFDDVPLLEELARAFSRDPSKLRMVEQVIQRIMRNTDDTSIIPPRFLEIWKVFQAAMAEVEGQ